MKNIMNPSLYPKCIYTIRNSLTLKSECEAGGTGQFIEHKSWVTGERLLEEARHHNQILPVLFAPAEGNIAGGINYWAFIDAITRASSATTVAFSNLRELPRRQPLRLLIKLSDHKPLSESFIRPYVPCETPTFLYRLFEAQGVRDRTIRSLARQVARFAADLEGEGAEDLVQDRYSPRQYAQALRHAYVTPHRRRMLEVHYHAPGMTLAAAEMAKALGYSSFGAANLHYGKLAALVAEQLKWDLGDGIALNALATFEKPDSQWHWIMRPAVARALELLGWVGAEAILLPEEIRSPANLYEGAARQITVNAYERNQTARAECVQYHGCACAVCGIVLADSYGQEAQGLIHVHHLRPLADLGRNYKIKPIEDLRPVCPNCHAVIHLADPPFTITQLQAMIRKQSRAKRISGRR